MSGLSADFEHGSHSLPHQFIFLSLAKGRGPAPPPRSATARRPSAYWLVATLSKNRMRYLKFIVDWQTKIWVELFGWRSESSETLHFLWFFYEMRSQKCHPYFIALPACMQWAYSPVYLGPIYVVRNYFGSFLNVKTDELHLALGANIEHINSLFWEAMSFCTNLAVWIVDLSLTLYW